METEKFRAIYEKYKHIRRNCIRSLCMFLLPVLVACWTHVTASGFFEQGYDSFAAGALPLIVSALIGAPMFYSLARLTTIYDLPLYERYRLLPDKRLSAKLRFFLCYRRFWSEIAAYTLLFLLLPLGLTSGALSELLVSGRADIQAKLLLLAVQLPGYFLLNLLARLSATRIWGKDRLDERDERGRRIAPNRSYLQHVAMSMILYPIGGTGLQILLPLFITLLPLIGEIVFSKFTVWLCIFFLSFQIIRYGRAVLARKRFLKRLSVLCRGRVKVRYPYRSLFGWYVGENFRVESNGKEYSCKFLSAPRPQIPLRIHSSGACEFLYIARIFNIELFRHTKRYEFDYESECPKLLIIQPRPKRVLGIHLGKAWEMDNGDRIGSYRVYTAGSFLNNLERDCLDK